MKDTPLDELVPEVPSSAETPGESLLLQSKLYSLKLTGWEHRVPVHAGVGFCLRGISEVLSQCPPWGQGVVPFCWAAARKSRNYKQGEFCYRYMPFEIQSL